MRLACSVERAANGSGDETKRKGASGGSDATDEEKERS
jgi:hypothetical protein